MAYENNRNFDEKRNSESVYSKRVKAGKRRTYFFDVKETRSNDFFITITESKRRFNDDGYDRHKMFIYKEDFNKFLNALTETVDHVKTDLMPDFDFDAFNHDYSEEEGQENVHNGVEVAASAAPAPTTITDEPDSVSSVDTDFDNTSVDKW